MAGANLPRVLHGPGSSGTAIGIQPSTANGAGPMVSIRRHWVIAGQRLQAFEAELLLSARLEQKLGVGAVTRLKRLRANDIPGVCEVVHDA